MFYIVLRSLKSSLEDKVVKDSDDDTLNETLTPSMDRYALCSLVIIITAMLWSYEIYIYIYFLFSIW